MREFRDADAEYVRWRDTHPQGFVLNCERRPRASYLKLHRATCRWLRWRGVLTGSYIKVCSDDPAEIVAWARAQTGGTPEPCAFCRP